MVPTETPYGVFFFWFYENSEYNVLSLCERTFGITIENWSFLIDVSKE